MSEVKKVGVAVIACGARSRGVVNNLLRDSKRGIEILAAYDPHSGIMDEAERVWEVDKEKYHRCSSYMEAINTPGVEWVMVFSPNAFHKEHILAAFNAGKHVFTEKPLATSIEDCQEIFDAHQKLPHLHFATGFVLRYAPMYQKIKEFLTSGKFGKLHSIEANENIAPGHGGYIMRNWRRKTEWAGPHVLEKCCHDLDLINWFCESLPSKVCFFGAKNVFKPENRFMEEKFGKETFNHWGGHDQIETAFNDDNDLMDTTMGCAIFRNGVQVSFCANMCNTMPERRMRFNCSEGTIILELYSRTIKYKYMNDCNIYTSEYNADGHGGGDGHIMKELWATMTEGVPPKCSGNEGLESAVFALGFDQAAREGKIIDLEPVWQKLNR